MREVPDSSNIINPVIDEVTAMMETVDQFLDPVLSAAGHDQLWVRMDKRLICLLNSSLMNM